MSAPAPIGLLFLARSENGLRHLEYLDRKSIRRVIASHADTNPGSEWIASLLELRDVTAQLEAYFHGSLREFDTPLDPAGTPAQLEVWRALGDIPYATTRTYGDLAKTLGQPKALRAITLAAQQNPIAIVAPDHRVVAADGKLVAYSGGLTRKKWLIEHEARFGRATVLPGEITETLHVPAVPTPERAVAVLVAKSPAGRAAIVARPIVKRPAAARAAVRAKASRTTETSRASKAAKSRAASPRRRAVTSAKSASRATGRRRS
jgi:methylated-DNA-[protein]-cysteine S-methyltransferase